MSVGLADNSVVILPSLEMEVGRYLHSCPTVSESQTLQKGWGVQAQHWWLLVNVTQLCFPHQQSVETCFTFCPPLVGLLGSKGPKDGLKGTVYLRGNVFHVQADEAFAVPPPSAGTAPPLTPLK